ncbi:MAG: hypothetical protein NTX49_03570 [Chlamydiae bacterium]|nr:hypothetical protein [Chlamydiota bacterium]
MKLKHKTAHQLLIEKQLITRLSFLGGLLIFFSACSLAYAFYVHPLPTIDNFIPDTEKQTGWLSLEIEEIESDIAKIATPEEILNFYCVSLIFGSLGLFCLFTSWKKGHILYKNR